MTKIVSFFVILSLFIVSSESKDLRYITSSPQNEAVFPGSEVKFVCLSNLTVGVDWTVVPVDQTALSVIRGCVLNPGYFGVYDVEQTAPGSCNIIVLSTTINEAGAYLCQEASGFHPPQSAQLVLLESDPECSISLNGENSTEVVEGDMVRMTCTVQYTTNLSPLTTQWTNPSGQQVWDTEWTTDSQYYSYTEFPAVPPSVDPYKAFTFFSAPVNSPTTATNTPTYTHTWTSPVLTVLYCPKNLTIQSSSNYQEEYAAGDNLTCFSVADPSPSYFWIDLETGWQIQGQSIIIPAEGFFHFLCTAYNFIHQEMCNASVEIGGNATAAKVVPRNTALILSMNGTMECKFGRNPLTWLFTGEGEPGVAIAPDCNVIPSLDSVYAVDREDGACNLIIQEAAKGQAGIYTCQEKDSPNRPPTAQLIILDSDPVCGDDLGDGIAVAGKRIRLSCRISYTGNIVPTMLWSMASGQMINNATNLTTAHEVHFIIDMPIYPDTLQSFTCETLFLSPIVPDSSITVPARNPPDYRYLWNSMARIVHYCAMDISISPKGSPIFVGDVLTCSASGYPTPSYRWTNLQTNETTEGQTLVVTSGGHLNYQCTAYNSIEGTTCSVSTTVQVLVYDFVSPGNVASEAGYNVTLSCRRKNPGMLWLFTAFESPSSVTVASNCQVLPAYSDKYSVSTWDNRCDLILQSVDESQAGAYTCQDPLSLDIPPSCIVVVLETTPDCIVNLTAGACEGRLSCSVNFTGQLVPVMNWTDHYGQPVDNVTYVATVSNLYSYIEFSVDVTTSAALEPFICKTYFETPSPSVFPPDGQTEPARNAPSYTDFWQSPTILFNNTWASESCPTLVQQNIGKSNSYFFRRNWNEYRTGFGTLAVNSSYWVGLNRLSDLTSEGNCSLHVDLLEAYTNRWYTAEYGFFHVDDSVNYFRLSVSDYDGNAGDALLSHSGYPFSTYDFGSYSSCANNFNGGFWYHSCFYAGINNSPDYYFYWYRNYPDNRPIYLEMSRLWLFCSS